MTCLIDLASITEETWPLILVILSVLLSGNLIRMILFAEDLKPNNLKFRDTITITAGVLINFITLYFLKASYSLEGFKIYTLRSTWMWIGLTTFIFGLVAWQYRLYGKKWIKDSISDMISVAIGILFMVLGLLFLGKLINLDSLNACIKNISCIIIVVLGKLFFLALVLFFVYYGYQLLKLKTRRYPKKRKK